MDEETYQLMQQVQNALTDNLLKPKYLFIKNRRPLTGHCYVASEALWHALGGKAGDWAPMFIRHEGAPHWFLRNIKNSVILDATSKQFETQVPYQEAKGKGFLTTKPSRRAQVVLGRIGHVTT